MKPYYTLADLLDEEHPFDAGESVPARLAVIGFPIAHSKSPAMQQAALDAAGIRARYIIRTPSPALRVPSIRSSFKRTALFPASIRTVRALDAPSGKNFPWTCAI